MNNDCFTTRELTIIGLIALIVALFFAHGYVYNTAETQAKSIKMCQSVGADWRYNDDNQVLCVKPKKKECD